MKDIHGGNIWEASKASGLDPQKLIDFSSSINPLGVPRGAEEAIKAAIGLIPAYPDPSCADLRMSLAAFHGLSPGNVLAGNGSTEFIYLIPASLRPRRALIVEPAFSEYRRALRLQGSSVKAHTLREKDGFAVDAERLVGSLKRGACDMVFIANPSNPAGALTKKEDLLEIAVACEKAGAVLVVDEAFIDFAEEGSIKAEASTVLKNTIVLRSMTKFFALSGLRLGFIAARKGAIDRLSRSLPPWSVNTLASAAALEALKDADYIRRTRKWLSKERDFLTEGLNNIKGLLPLPSSANFILVKIDKPKASSKALAAGLLKKGILIRPLDGFIGLGPEYFRIAVKKRSDNSTLLTALKDLF